MKIAAIEIIENASGDVVGYDLNVNHQLQRRRGETGGRVRMGAAARCLARSSYVRAKGPSACLRPRKN